MRAAWLGLLNLFALNLLAVSAASAYDATDPANCTGIGWDDARPLTVARVTGQPRVNFVKSPYDDDFKAASCPAPTEACRKKSYLVSDDWVLVGRTRGNFTCVTYQPPRTKSQTWARGWLPRAALAPVAPMAAPTLSDWTGSWVHPGGQLTIKAAGGGRLRIEGDQVVPAGRDLNNGSIAATAQPKGGVIAFVEDGTTPFEQPNGADECRVRLQRIGALLLVEDNNDCGGAGVSFTGLYHRRQRAQLALIRAPSRLLSRCGVLVGCSGRLEPGLSWTSSQLEYRISSGPDEETMALRGWRLNLKLDLKRGPADVPVYLQIVHGLLGEIRRGRLIPGEVLPGSREMAQRLGVNRKTVMIAYDELIAQGWLTSRGTKGTFVSAKLPEPKARPSESSNDGVRSRNEARNIGRLAPAVQLPVIFPQPGMLLLDDGTPDTRLFPAMSFSRAYRSIMTVGGKVGKLGYGDPRGNLSLRSAISRMLNVDRGLATTPEHICLTRGSQMAIYLVSRLMIRPGDHVVVDDLTYPPACEAFRMAGANILRVRVDDDGTDMASLEKVCRRHRVRLVYLTPHHHFPTTVLLSPTRRLRLLELASRFGFVVVEDDYDHEFHFQHQPLLPLASFDPSVLYIGSMSKLLSPSLRLGYMFAPAKFIERAAQEICLIDRQGDPVTEQAVAELVETGEVRRHASRARKIYATRRKKLAALLRAELHGTVDFRLPDGGLAFWLTFVRTSDLDRLEQTAPKHGLQFLPSRSFSGRPDGRRGIRIGFAALDDAGLREAVRRMKAAIAS